VDPGLQMTYQKIHLEVRLKISGKKIIVDLKIRKYFVNKKKAAVIIETGLHRDARVERI
jgi:hypothetical protein